MQLPNLTELEQGIDFRFYYLVCVYDVNDIYHLCCYENKPGVDDINQLLFELRTDSDFNIDPLILDGVMCALMTKEQYVDFYNFMRKK